MNALREALETVKLDFSYWTYALTDVVDKFNQLPHSEIGKSPKELWIEETMKLKSLYIFGQHGFVPVMTQPKRKKYDLVILVQYFRREGPN